MYIDTHAHLNFKAFNKDLDDVINRAKESGIEKIIIPGAKIDSSIKAVEISSRHKNAFAAIGIHPHHTEEFMRLGKEAVILKLENLLKESISNKIVAVGEIGFDFYRYKGNPKITQEEKIAQEDLLHILIEIAHNYHLPIIFHCRKAFNPLLKFIRNILSRYNIPGVFHCFSGNMNDLNKVLNMGFYIGFDGNITYEENDHLREVVRATPLDRLLLETDSPFLTPVPSRGKRNEPSNLTFIAECVAKIQRKQLSEISETTRDNALKLFNL